MTASPSIRGENSTALSLSPTRGQKSNFRSKILTMEEILELDPDLFPQGMVKDFNFWTLDGFFSKDDSEPDVIFCELGFSLLLVDPLVERTDKEKLKEDGWDAASGIFSDSENDVDEEEIKRLYHEHKVSMRSHFEEDCDYESFRTLNLKCPDTEQFSQHVRSRFMAEFAIYVYNLKTDSNLQLASIDKVNYETESSTDLVYFITLTAMDKAVNKSKRFQTKVLYDGVWWNIAYVPMLIPKSEEWSKKS